MRESVIVIGGGIVGLSTAYQLSNSYPDIQITVLEKESELARHQTGRNSGVIHSGIYYKPGSLKAENCREGRKALVAFCEEHQVAYDVCGKVIVAVNQDEIPRLQNIQARGEANGIQNRWIDTDELRTIEPHCRGVAALHVPEAGIVDYRGVCLALASILTQRGHQILTDTAVNDLKIFPESVVIETNNGDFESTFAANCAGLYSDKIAAMSGLSTDIQIVPFRGEYYELTDAAKHLVRNLIYPVPDPAYPFLGVHFTRMYDGRIECGPSAIIAFAREGYRLTDVHWGEFGEMLSFPGTWRLSLQHWRKGILELRQSLSKSAYLSALKGMIPSITLDDIVPAPAGVRAQALRADGSMVDDFLFMDVPRVVNVINAASPAATSALNVGKLIAARFENRLSSNTRVAT